MPCSPTMETRPPRPARASSSRPSSSARSAVRPAKGSPRSDDVRAGAELGLDGVGLDRCRPALHGEGLERVGLEQGPGLVEHPGGRIASHRAARPPSGGRPGSRCRPSPCRCCGTPCRPRRRTRGRGWPPPGGSSRGRASSTSRMARTSRPSSSSWASGTPVVRSTLKPLLSRSLARNVTPSRSVARWTIRMASSRSAARASRPPPGQHVVGALEAHETDRGDPVLGLDGPGQGVAQARPGGSGPPSRVAPGGAAPHRSAPPGPGASAGGGPAPPAAPSSLAAGRPPSPATP